MTDPTALRAHCVVIEGSEIDPYALVGGDGFLFDSPTLTVAGFGRSATLGLPDGLAGANDRGVVADWLKGVLPTGASQPHVRGAIAFAALPFTSDELGLLLVPEFVLVTAEDGQWAIHIAADPIEDPAALRATLLERCDATLAVETAPSVRSIAPVLEPKGYVDAVSEALKPLRARSIGKVVLARGICAEFNAPIEPVAVLRRLHQQEPSCTAFSFPLDKGQFVGASPELLVSLRGDEVRCHPLAGTVGLGDDRAANDAAIEWLRTSAKNQNEHQYVVDEIASTLQRRCDDITASEHPALVELHTVCHLGTEVTATLRANQSASVIDLVADLHPTPAVGGVPQDLALALIDALEPEPRGLWAGPVGWIDGAGNGDWVIGIRSASIDGSTAYLTAGAGIVVGSDPEAELAETTVKLLAVLLALAPDAGDLLV